MDDDTGVLQGIGRRPRRAGQVRLYARLDRRRGQVPQHHLAASGVAELVQEKEALHSR